MLKFTNVDKTSATFNGASFSLTTPEDWDSIGDTPTREAVHAWLAAGNTPEPADVPDPQLAINAKLAQLRQIREAILNRLAGIAGRADRAGNTALAAACDVGVQGLLNITQDLPAELGALELTVMTRYQTLAYAAELAAPGLGAAFAGVDL